MATGINYDDPEFQKGYELFEQLFADRLYPPEVPEDETEPTPTTLEGSSLEDEPTPEMEPSPVVEARKQRYLVTPPRWLWTSMDSYESSPSYGEEIAEPEPVEPRSSIPPVRPKVPTPEPAVPEVQPKSRVSHDFQRPPKLSSYDLYDMALQRMRSEIQKYQQDEKYILQFIELAPLVRDTQILREELELMADLYVPDQSRRNTLHITYLLDNYIKNTQAQMFERHEDLEGYQYPHISQGILAAEIRVHRKKAIEAINTYKRQYFVLLREIERSEKRWAEVQQELEVEHAEWEMWYAEIERLKAEDKAVENEYLSGMTERHNENCPYKEEGTRLFKREMELRCILLPNTRKQLKSLVEKHNEEVKSMSLWLSLFPPEFECRIYQLLCGRLSPAGYNPVPMEAFVELGKYLEEDLLRMLSNRQHSLGVANSECESLKKALNERKAELDEAKKYTGELLAKKNALGAELLNIRIESKKWIDLSAKARKEKLYLQEYNTMLLEKIMTLQADDFLRSIELPAIAGPSPIPVGASSTKERTASPTSFRSEMFDIGQIGVQAPSGVSSGLVDEEHSPSEISDLPPSGASTTDQVVSPGQTEVDNLNNEQPPSDLSRSGDSPGEQSMPQSLDQNDYLADEGSPLEMMNISDPSGSGGPAAEAIAQGLDQYGNLDDEQSPFDMMNISDLSGSGSPTDESINQGQADSDNPDHVMNFSGLQRGESFLDSLASSNASSIKKTVSVPSPGRKERLQLDIELIPQEIKRSPSGRRVVCDVSVLMEESNVRIPRRGIEQRYKIVRGTPPISQTVGRNVDRRYGMFTPKSAFKRQYVGARRPLFQEDFESPESPYGTGRTTHPELMNLPEHPSVPRPLDTTMEWENPEMNPEYRK